MATNPKLKFSSTKIASIARTQQITFAFRTCASLSSLIVFFFVISQSFRWMSERMSLWREKISARFEWTTATKHKNILEHNEEGCENFIFHIHIKTAAAHNQPERERNDAETIKHRGGRNKQTNKKKERRKKTNRHRFKNENKFQNRIDCMLGNFSGETAESIKIRATAQINWILIY